MPVDHNYSTGTNMISYNWRISLELEKEKQSLIQALKNLDYDSYITILSEILPKKIYRYFDHTGYKIDLLINNRIQLSSPLEFNDPYDSLATFEKEVENRYYGKIEYTIQKILNSNDAKVQELKTKIIERGVLSSEIDWPDKIKIIKEEQQKLLGDNDGPEYIQLHSCLLRLNDFHGFNNPRFGDWVSDSKVCCFSTAKNSTLMWAHYGRMNSGLCIEYDTSKILEDINDEKYLFVPVVYSEEMYKDDPYPLSERTTSLFWNLPQFMYKKGDWSYEQEWRLIIPNCIEDSLFFPYAKQIFLGTNFKNFNKYSNEPENEQTACLIRLFDFARTNNVNVVKLKTNSQKYEFVEEYLI